MFFIQSNERHSCPLCGGKLTSRDSRIRKVIVSGGEKISVQIRRLKCKECGRLHVELPDFIHPFRHYSSSTIQDVLDGKPEECSAEDSTMQRWICSFHKALSKIESTLISIWMQEKGKPWNLLHGISLLEKIRHQQPENWLAFVNQRLLRFGFGTYTQFAFCLDPLHDTLASKHKRKGQVP